jgi:hypothetical protein
MSSMGKHYDHPHTRRIKLAGGSEEDTDATTATAGGNATATTKNLDGIIVGVEDDDGRMMPSTSLLHLSRQSGGTLIGEVIDILDNPEAENEMKSSSSSSSSLERMEQRWEERRIRMRLDASEGGLLSSSFVEDAMRYATTTMREGKVGKDDVGDDHYDAFVVISKTLQRRQRQLQSAYAQEYRHLLYKQEKDWLWFHEHRLGEDRLIELLDIHQRESLEMHSLHQTEQREMLDFVMFKCMLPLTKTPTDHGREQAQARIEKRPSTTPTTQTNEPTLPTADLANGMSRDMQKADEIKAVMRDRSITREERHAKLAEIKERYASSSMVAVHDNGRGHDGEPRKGSTEDELLPTKKREPLADIVPTNLPSDSMFRESSGSEGYDQAGEDDAHKSSRWEEGTMGAVTTGKSREKSVSERPRGVDNTMDDDPNSSSREDVTGTCDLGDDDAPGDDDKEKRAKVLSGREKDRREKSRAKIEKTNSRKAVDNPEASKGVVKEVEVAKDSSDSKSRPIPSKDESEKYVTKPPRDVTNSVDENAKFSSHQNATNGKGASAIAASVEAPKPNVSDNPDDPLDTATDRTPMKTLIKRLNNSDSSLAVLKLDGRKLVKEDDWQALFESLAKNSTLTHLSISRCDINDSLCTALIAALIENTVLVEVRLNSNKSLTDYAGKGLIKMLERNSTLKHVGVVRTGISNKVVEELAKALVKRNSRDKKSKFQDERQMKIKEIHSLVVGDKAGKESAAEKGATKSDEIRNSSPRKVLASRKESSKNSLISKSSSSSIAKTDSWKSKKSTSSNDGKKKETERQQSVRSREVEEKRSSVDNGDVMRRRGSTGSSEVTGRKSIRRASVADDGRRPPSRPNMRPEAHRNSMLRASVTAKTMAQLGEDITNVGVDISKLKEQRKFRGECETCGRKCYTKTLFKTTPLTIPDMVENGRCLRCDH